MSLVKFCQTRVLIAVEDLIRMTEIGHVDCCCVLYCAFFSVYYSVYSDVPPSMIRAEEYVSVVS